MLVVLTVPRLEWPDLAELVFFSGTMDCGKSTLALQMDHNHSARGRDGRDLHPARPRGRRRALLAARPDAARPHEVDDATDFWADVIARRTHGATASTT